MELSLEELKLVENHRKNKLKKLETKFKEEFLKIQPEPIESKIFRKDFIDSKFDGKAIQKCLNEWNCSIDNLTIDLFSKDKDECECEFNENWDDVGCECDIGGCSASVSFSYRNPTYKQDLKIHQQNMKRFIQEKINESQKSIR